MAVLEASIGFTFREPALLATALTHSSFANEHPDDPLPPNERLEFLGDAVLGMIVAEALYTRFPEIQEGRLTEWRAQLVCGPTLARVAADRLDLGAWLRLGRGEEATGGREREGNLERALEAVVGAVYLDRDLDATRDFVDRMLRDDFEALEGGGDQLNPKGALQQLTQGVFGRPDYSLLAAEGPEHDRRFRVQVRVDGVVVGEGEGTSKQQAEKEAAREALATLRRGEQAGAVEGSDAGASTESSTAEHGKGA
ncbi:MAG: ribonuclease III [Dehalococcoidia bacterium]|nr:ribonuclease III [Dehalococcoidia bacterium]